MSVGFVLFWSFYWKNVIVIIQQYQLRSHLNHLEIEEIEIINPPTREVVISYLKDKYLTGPMQAFIEALSYLF